MAAAVALTASACATIDPSRGHTEVAALVDERIGAKTGWDRGTPDDAAIQKHVDELLSGGLTVDHAIAIALINNPGLQRTYEELGVSQADLVQAGLWSNPGLEAHVGLALPGEGISELNGGLVMDFLQLFVLPLRKRVAEEQFDADVLRVAHEALGVAAEVDRQFREVQAREKLVALRRSVVDGEAASAELAQQLFAAGNITQLELASRRARYEEARVALGREELALVEAREDLNKLLGLWGARTSWKLAAELPPLPEKDPPLEHLEATAIRQRLDIEAARLQRALMWKAVELARSTRWFGQIEVGVDAHRDADGPRLLGPTLSLELPVFDQRQAVIARLEAQFRQAERRLDELSIDARSDVRRSVARLGFLRQTVEHYRKVVLPLREEVLEQAQLQYNGMQIGLFELVQAKQEQVDAYATYIEAVRDYWQERAQLRRLVGGRIRDSE